MKNKLFYFKNLRQAYRVPTYNGMKRFLLGGFFSPRFPKLKLKILVVLCLALIPLSCSKVPEVPDFLKDTFQPEMIVPVFDPDAHIMPQTGTIGYVKNGVKAMAVPLNDVKAVDAFGIFIFNVLRSQSISRRNLST